MTFRPALLLVAALLALPVVQGCGGGNEPKAKHVLFISVDTLRYDRLGCYGGSNRPSPTIDALAASGTRFTNAYVQRAITLSSFASFFTSRYPDETGILNNNKVVPRDERLLAERLAEARFHCVAFQSSGVLDPRRSGIEQGFDKYHMELDEGRMTNRACEFVRSNFGKDGRRQFMWVHFMRPHRPYAPPSPYDKRFTKDYQGFYDGSSDTLDRIFVKKEKLAPADLDHILGLYDGTIAFVDDCIASLLTALREAGHADDTLIVFAADHGEELYERHAYFYHSSSLYRSCVQIPLIFAQPGRVVPQVRDDLVENVDFVPTVLSWLGLEADDPSFRGYDLGDVLQGRGTVPRDFVTSQWEDVIYGIRNREWFYVDNPEDVMPVGPPDEGVYPIDTRELYDLRADPREQTNVVASNVAQADRMREALDRFRSELVIKRVEDDLSADRMQMLRENGYIGNTPNPRRTGKKKAPPTGTEPPPVVPQDANEKH
jgi:arylsulfatase